MLKSLVSILHTNSFKEMKTSAGASLVALILSKFVHGMFQTTGSQKLESDSIFFHDTRVTQEGQTGAQREECYAKHANRMREGIWGWLQVIQNFLSEVCFPLQIFKIHIYTGSDFYSVVPQSNSKGSQENRAVLTDKLLAGVLPCCSGEQWENSSCALLSAGLWTWFSVGLLVQDRVEMKTERVRQEGAGTCDTVCLLLVLSHLLVWQSGMFHFHSTTLKGNKIWDCGCVSARG